MSEMSAATPSDSRDLRAKSQLMKDNFPLNAEFLFFEALAHVRKAEPRGDDWVNLKQILNKMLHSILFIGNIHASKYKPEEIFDKREIYDQTKKNFSEPFEFYRTHVPLRTPFSYFLELVLKCYGQNNEDRVKDILFNTLQKYKELGGKKAPLISTVMCICESGGSRYYGVSLSCGSIREREIMTAVSCQHIWHPKVASAVMSVFPDGTGEPRSIRLPDTVRCRAYEVADVSQLKPPCKQCNQLYSLPDHTEHKNKPGNCAETEAISNFFNAERHLCLGNFRRKNMRRYFDTNMKKLMDSRVVQNRDKYSINNVYSP